MHKSAAADMSALTANIEDGADTILSSIRRPWCLLSGVTLATLLLVAGGGPLSAAMHRRPAAVRAHATIQLARSAATVTTRPHHAAVTSKAVASAQRKFARAFFSRPTSCSAASERSGTQHLKTLHAH